MSFFNKDHHDFHYLAGMLAGAGLLVMAAVFISSGGLGAPGRGLASLDFSPGSQTAALCGVSYCGTTSDNYVEHNYSMHLWACNNYTDSGHPQCQDGSGNNLSLPYSQNGYALWRSSSFANLPQDANRFTDTCYLSGGQFNNLNVGDGNPGPSYINIKPAGQVITYSFRCTEHQGRGDYSYNQTVSATLHYCAQGEIVDSLGKCVSPLSQPAATISADSQSIAMGQSVGIHATFSAGQGDTLVGTNIDSPEGHGLGANTTPGAKDIVFTPTAAGTYTFYARIQTQAYPTWASYKTVTVTVAAAPGPSGLSASCNAAGTSVATSWSAVSGATYYWVGLDDTTNNKAFCQSGWNCSTPPDYSQNVKGGTSQTFAVQPNHAERLLVSSCIKGSSGGEGRLGGAGTGDTCSGASELDFTCKAPVAGLSITANGQTGLANIPVNTPVTIAWSSQNIQAGSCKVTNNGDTTVWQEDNSSGHNVGTLTTGRIYTLSCNKAGGTPAAPATVTIGVAPGSVDGPLTATPGRVLQNTNTKLSWHTVGMIDCSLDSNTTGHVSSALASSGTNTAVPHQTTFTLTCHDGTHTFAQSVDVGVIPIVQEQ
ncbi:MAG TPA: hypothetical protein VGP13_03575 [Candidatus Paceibacterota bacterium]|jgi:hypothetical protein|nr:hypothetical protein [Candidatus Paceibacterota bacterium]